MSQKLDLGSTVRQAMEEAYARLGRANILIAGRTGVGKSTLINAIFQGNLATTGMGRPVTQSTREYTREGLPLSIFDTRGLEMADFAATLRDLKEFVRVRCSERDPAHHIHLFWLCVSEDSRRVERAESDLAAALAEHTPGLAVITKARADHGFRDEVQRLLPTVGNVVRVRALPDHLDDGHVLPPMGLLELVDATIELAPQGQRDALTAAQRVDIERKKKRAHTAVAGAAAAAAAAGAVPIPIADAMVLVPIQISMLATITAIFGAPLDKGSLVALLGPSAATFTGRAIVGGLLKLAPGVGTIIGGAIQGSTAAAITVALGEAYIAVLARLFAEHQGNPPTAREVVQAFRRQVKTDRQARHKVQPTNGA